MRVHQGDRALVPQTHTHTHFPFNFPDFRPIERRLEATEGPENVPTIVGVLSLLVERGLKTESE